MLTARILPALDWRKVMSVKSSKSNPPMLSNLGPGKLIHPQTCSKCLQVEKRRQKVDSPNKTFKRDNLDVPLLDSVEACLGITATCV